MEIPGYSSSVFSDSCVCKRERERKRDKYVHLHLGNKRRINPGRWENKSCGKKKLEDNMKRGHK